MKIFAINGSPRKNQNTATLLKHAVDGAAAQMNGAELETINLYDLNFKGCVSCFACKLIGGVSYGQCGYKDDLTPILPKILEADVLILGSPIYFENVTGVMRSFLERLMFPVLTYTPGYKSIQEKKIPIGFIYTMNVTKEYMTTSGYLDALKFAELDLERMFGHCEHITSNDTYQFSDYSKYLVTVYDIADKEKTRREQFPIDCENAKELGSRLAKKAGKI